MMAQENHPCWDCMYEDVCECSDKTCGPANNYAFFTKKKVIDWVEEVLNDRPSTE